MQRSQFNIIIKSQAGLGYVAILVLLAILSTMGLAFIYKVGLMSSVTLNRRTSMQAHYLAESAANHALWNLLNNPEFAPESDKYYMHSLGDGRYGYKVRMPTETTFATVATVGAMGDIATQQSYVQYIIPSNVFTAYGSSTSSLPRYRRLIGAQWTNPGDVLFGGAEPVYWLELEGCPIRKELVAGIIDSVGEIKVAVYDGATWGNAAPFGHGDQNYKCFDIAYESQSGEALVVSRDGTNTTVYYNIWDGTNWAFASPQTAFNLDIAYLRLVTMASCPGNDDILIATIDSDASLKVFHWNGSAFANLGTIVNGGMPTGNYGVVQIVYEQQSGDALVIWSSGGEVRYRIWNGSTLGPENIISLIPDDVFILRAAADPASDTIVLGSIDKFYDITVVVWDGDAWIDSREVETSCGSRAVQAVDVAWESSGEDALVVWQPSSSATVRYLAWEKGTALADTTVEQGPDFQNPWLVRLHPISQSEKIILLIEDYSNDLRYSLWDGERFKGDPAILLESDIPVLNEVAFDLTEANVPRSGGTGTGSEVNQPPVVDAGPDQTLIFPTMETSLDGTVTDDGLPNPPATVTTTWTLVSGPGTVVFVDASQVDTKITVSDPGTYVFRLTADDSELSAFDEVTIIISKLCTILFVVPDESNLGSLDSARKALLESWSFAVVPFTASKTQADYDLAVSNVDVVYVSSTVYYADVTSKLKWLPVGVVNEVSALTAYLGFTSGSSGSSGTQTAIVDNTHEITSPFSTGTLTITSSTQSLHRFVNTIGPGFQTLSTTTWSADPMLMTLDEGDELLWGGNAPARRVMLPWGGSAFNVNALNDDGKTIMQRALEWAAQCSAGGSLLFVVNDASSLSPQETARKAMMEAWGWTVTLISASAPQAKFDTEAATSSVAYISQEALATSLASKLNEIPIGAVNENKDMIDDFGFATGLSMGGGLPTLNVDPNHYITSTLGTNPVAPYVANDWYQIVDEPVAAGVDPIGTWAESPWTGKPALMTLNKGSQLVGGGAAAGRRVQIPWGSGQGATPVALDSLSDDAKTIMRRALEWASDTGAGGNTDTDPPTPDPMTWAKPPQASDPTTIGMMATTATDPSGVEYYFECTEGGGNDSGWQSSSIYVDSGLSPNTKYAYRVKARDRSSNQNETTWSSAASAMTLSNVMYVQDIAMGYRRSGATYYGQATVWIRSGDGANISGAIVSGTWSGVVTGSSMGTTGSDGKVMLESSGNKNGGTFTFTVTNVTKLGYIYDSSLNVETSDSITPP